MMCQNHVYYDASQKYLKIWKKIMKYDILYRYIDIRIQYKCTSITVKVRFFAINLETNKCTR